MDRKLQEESRMVSSWRPQRQTRVILCPLVLGNPQTTMNVRNNGRSSGPGFPFLGRQGNESASS